MRTMYDQELKNIQRDAYKLGNLVCDILADMLKAAYRKDFATIEKLYEDDHVVRGMRMKLNDRVVKVVATQNPLGADLRNLFFFTHLADELLRISSQAIGIGHVVIRCEKSLLLFEDVYRMGEKTVAMLDQALSSAIKGDEEQLLKIIGQDDDVDVIYEQITRECTSRMDAGECENSMQVMNTYKMARRVEIIGDSIVNLCRWWLFFNGERDKNAEILV